MNPPTKSQEIMIQDGLPQEAVVTQEERREAWKGRKLTRMSATAEKPKEEDPVARQLRKEAEHAADLKKKAGIARLREIGKQNKERDDELKRALDAARAYEAPTQETDVKKQALKKTPKKTKNAAKGAATRNARSTAAPKKPPIVVVVPAGRVSGQQVADFVSRAGGASMDELVAEFKIDAHPMRAKIFYVRHTLGYDVEVKDGRYHGTSPKVSK